MSNFFSEMLSLFSEFSKNEPRMFAGITTLAIFAFASLSFVTIMFIFSYLNKKLELEEKERNRS